MLTPEELEQIRQIVREEMQKAIESKDLSGGEWYEPCTDEEFIKETNQEGAPGHYESTFERISKLYGSISNDFPEKGTPQW